ncbi:hypothetical protein [Dactylosporangium sp. CA-139066]|uniref:hypothetical protein n=1 Tax=Dactylosporangium sp. CA-139066 TaxID=3239930 RepID=UPI003D8FCDC1
MRGRVEAQRVLARRPRATAPGGRRRVPRALWLSDDVADGRPLLALYVALGALAGGLLAPWVRTRPMLVRNLPPGIIGVSLAAFGLQFDSDDPTMPAALALPITAGIAGLAIAAAAVAVLWISGRYTIELHHRASVRLTSERDTEFYQARCDCGWRSTRFALGPDDDAEREAFAAAHEHTPSVRQGVELQW